MFFGSEGSFAIAKVYFQSRIPIANVRVSRTLDQLFSGRPFHTQKVVKSIKVSFSCFADDGIICLESQIGVDVLDLIVVLAESHALSHTNSIVL